MTTTPVFPAYADGTEGLTARQPRPLGLPQVVRGPCSELRLPWSLLLGAASPTPRPCLLLTNPPHLVGAAPGFARLLLTRRVAVPHICTGNRRADFQQASAPCWDQACRSLERQPLSPAKHPAPGPAPKGQREFSLDRVSSPGPQDWHLPRRCPEGRAGGVLTWG